MFFLDTSSSFRTNVRAHFFSRLSKIIARRARRNIALSLDGKERAVIERMTREAADK
jgi:hypothetical protein